MTELTDKTAVSDPPMFEEGLVDDDNDLERVFDRAFLAMATPAPPSMPTLPPIPPPPPVELHPSAFEDIFKGEIVVPDKPRVAAGSKPRVDPKMWGDAPSRAVVPKRPSSPSGRRAPRKSGPYQSLWRADASLARDDASIRSSVYKSVAPAPDVESPIWSPEPAIIAPESAPSVIVAEASEPVREQPLYAPLHLDPLPADVELAKSAEPAIVVAVAPAANIEVAPEPQSDASASWPAERTAIAPEHASKPSIALAPELDDASASWPAESTALAPEPPSQTGPAVSAEDESWWQSELAAARSEEPPHVEPQIVEPAPENESPAIESLAMMSPANDAASSWQEPAAIAPPASDAASSWQPEPLEPPPSASQLEAIAWENEPAPASSDAPSSFDEIVSPAAADSASWTTPVELASPSDLAPGELPSECHGEINIDAFHAPIADVAPADAANDSPANDFPANDFPANDFPANDFPANDFPANDFPANDIGPADLTASQMRGEIEPALPEPALAETVPAAAEAVATEQPAAEAAPTKIGEVITVFGCRGGCGATTIAVNLAGSLAAAGKEVCIVDLDVQLGDVLVTLDLDATGAASLVNLAREVHTLDPEMLKRRLVRHDSGVYVLAQGGRLEEIDDTLPSKIPMLIAVLARHFDAIIIDGVDDFSELALSAIDAANVIALVVTQEVLAVRRGRRVIDICRQLEVPSYKIKPVINCYRKRAKVDRSSVSAGLGVEVAATVVEDERTTKRSQTAGQLLQEMARRKGVTKDIAALQELASSVTRPQPTPSAADETAPEDAIDKLAADAKS